MLRRDNWVDATNHWLFGPSACGPLNYSIGLESPLPQSVNSYLRTNWFGGALAGKALALFALVAFGALIAGLAVEKPLCCADDASFAVVSKNLAQGHGYLLTLSYFGLDFSGTLFEANLGTGPTSILPVAAAIWLFGAHPAVPGLVHVVIALASIVFLWRVVAVRMPDSDSTAFVIAFILLICATSGYHFEQWHAQLGEVPAALLIVAGCMYWSATGSSRRAALLCGLCIGLASMSKILAVLYAFGPLVALATRRSTLRAFIADLVLFGIGVALPILAFEAWKAAVLGLDGWQQHWKGFFGFLDYQSKGASSATGLALLRERLSVLSDRFALHWLVLLAAVPMIVAAALRANIRWRFGLVALAAGFSVHFVYWTGFSNGWPRYFFIGIVVLAFLIAAVMAIRSTPALRVAALALTLAVAAAGLPRMSMPIDALASAVRSPSAIDAARETTRRMEALGPAARVYAQWWAHVAALEYLAAKPGRFLRTDRKPDSYEGAHLVVHDGFLDKGDKVFMGLLADCTEVLLRAPPYTVHRCPQGTPRIAEPTAKE